MKFDQLLTLASMSRKKLNEFTLICRHCLMKYEQNTKVVLFRKLHKIDISRQYMCMSVCTVYACIYIQYR